jgi:transposase
MKKYIGLDAHSKQITFCIVDEKANQLASGQIESNPDALTELIKENNIPNSSVFCVESGTQAFWVSRKLISEGMDPFIVVAEEAFKKRSRSKRKTDFIDAFELAFGICKGIFTRFVYVPTLEIEKLRTLYSLRELYVKNRTGIINSAKSRIRIKCPGITMPSLHSEKSWEKSIKSESFSDIKFELKSLYRCWKTLEKQIEIIEKEIFDLLENYKDLVERYVEIPGIKKLSAGIFISAIGDPNRFKNAKQIGSYLGVVPSLNSSGDNDKRGRITKQGPKRVRSLIYNGFGLNSCKENNPFSPITYKIRAKTGIANKGIIAAMHKLFRVMWSMWKNESEFNPYEFGAVKTKIKTKPKEIYVLIRNPN